MTMSMSSVMDTSNDDTPMCVDEDLFEDELLRTPFSVDAWLRYVEFNASTKSSRSQSCWWTLRCTLYERALAALPRSYKIWVKYLIERCSNTLSRPLDERAIDAAHTIYAFERALSSLPSMPVLWLVYGQFLTNIGLVSRTRNVYDRAVQALPITQHHLVWPRYTAFCAGDKNSSTTSHNDADDDDGVIQIAHPIVPCDTLIRVFRRYIKINPDARQEFSVHLRRASARGPLIELLAEMVNDPMFPSATLTASKSRGELWAELCALLSQYPSDVPNSVDAEAVLRCGVERFSTETAKLWTALADHYIRLGRFERARDVYEEAMSRIMTVRDFGVVFDAYALFEESMLSAKIDASEGQPEDIDEDDDDDFNVDGDDVDLRLLRLDNLINKRPILVNTVLLKQNPHNVRQWLKRVRLHSASADNEDDDCSASDEQALQVYTEAIKTIEPSKASGKLHKLWDGWARLYERNEDIDSARLVFERATHVQFRTYDELAECFCLWAEMEIRQKQYERALQVVRRATATAPTDAVLKAVADNMSKKEKKILRKTSKNSSSPKNSTPGIEARASDAWRSTRVWQLYADLEENLGSIHTASNVYDRMLTLGVATPQTVVQQASMLITARHYERAFAAYERGLARFPRFPHALPLWLTYLRAFTQRYGERRIERARELFESAVSSAVERPPPDAAAPLYALYAAVEERYGRSKRALDVYERAIAAIVGGDNDDALRAAFKTLVTRASALAGVAYVRGIYERAISLEIFRGAENVVSKKARFASPVVADAIIRDVCVEYAKLERSLGEIDRVRAIYSYGAQLANPHTDQEFWKLFHDFEVQHGNEDTFREMLRLRRSVAADMAQTQFTATTASIGKNAGAQLEQNAMQALEADASTALSDESLKLANVAAANMAGINIENPEEISLDDEEDEEETESDRIQIEQVAVPKEVFGNVLEKATGEQKKAIGALERFRKN